MVTRLLRRVFACITPLVNLVLFVTLLGWLGGQGVFDPVDTAGDRSGAGILVFIFAVPAVLTVLFGGIQQLVIGKKGALIGLSVTKNVLGAIGDAIFAALLAVSSIVGVFFEAFIDNTLPITGGLLTFGGWYVFAAVLSVVVLVLEIVFACLTIKKPREPDQGA
jgi:hypothetical protein